MSRKERRRLEALSRVAEGQWTLVEVAERLGTSYRQIKRCWARYQTEGDEGLVHRLRGRASNRQSPPGWRERFLALYAEKYADYGPTYAAECLLESEGLAVPVTTLRRWLLDAGLWQPKRRRKAHRRRRARRPRFGDLVQMDGSHHDWFEGRRAEAVLMVMVDDATGRVHARFFEEETLVAAWTTFRGWVERHGVPRALYVDRHGIYRAEREPTSEEVLAGKRPQTQFGRSMEDLGVELILAHSPQAKGRVERMNGTLQDRLVKALRQAGISDLENANRFLEREFLPKFAERFSRPAAETEDGHAPLPSGVDLDRVLAIQEARTVQNDWTVRWSRQSLQLPDVAGLQPGQRVTVVEQTDGRLRVFSNEQEIAWEPAGARRAARKRPVRRRALASNQGQRPAADHPWRRPLLQRRAPASEVARELACSATARLALASAPQANSRSP
jgi:transposase